jgi:DNA-binding response OmpR family regulator
MKRSLPDHVAPREVLVVEDEPQMRALLTDNLEFEGYHVTAVDSAEAAVAEVARGPVSLVLLDLMLPGMSGFAFCERLRNEGARVPIIILTARTHEQDRIRGLDLAPTTTSASRSACAN